MQGRGYGLDGRYWRGPGRAAAGRGTASLRSGTLRSGRTYVPNPVLALALDPIERMLEEAEQEAQVRLHRYELRSGGRGVAPAPLPIVQENPYQDEGKDEADMYDEKEDGDGGMAIVPPGAGVLGPVLNPVIPVQTPYGEVTMTHTSAAAGEGEDRVPLYDVDLRINTRTATAVGFDFQQLATFCCWRAYHFALGLAGANMHPNDYVQIRLYRSADMAIVFDLTSDMLPLDNSLDDFIQTYLLMLQSDLAKLIYVNDVDLRFHYTFVLANRGQRRVGLQNYPALVRHFRSSAVTDQQRAANVQVLHNRYIVHEQVYPQAGRVGHAAFVNRAALAQANRVLRRYERGAKEPLRALLGPQLLTAPIVNVVQAAPPVIDPVPVPRAPVRMRAPWTAEQRRRYNENRQNARRVAANLVAPGQNQVRGVYEDLKKRIFHHASIEEFFSHSKAVCQVPTSWDEGYCLGMAFLHSEMRTYSFHDGLDALTVEESQPVPFFESAESVEPYITCPISEAGEALKGRKSPFIYGNEIVLFNPYKKPSSSASGTSLGKYSEPLTLEEVQTWYQAAAELHRFVVQECGHEVDPNDETSMQEYSDVFGVYIFVYRAEVQGRRTNFYKPYNEPSDIRASKELRVVCILVGDQHATAITSLREFTRSSLTANRSTIYNYCVICEKQSTANNENIQESRAHFSTCVASHKGRLSCFGDVKAREKSLSLANPSPFACRKKRKDKSEATASWCCKLCTEELGGGLDTQMDHVCYIQKPDELKIGDEKSIYVYDMECAQIFDPIKNVFVHKVNLVCVRRAYPDASGDCDRHHFLTLTEFMEYIMKQDKQNRTYLAHNGSKYDVQFIMQYLEKNLIPHSFVPTPSSMHAYLSVTIAFGGSVQSTFIDFRHFMPGSLKNIGLSFGLSVAKGDFPHHFNNGYNDTFVGALPATDDEEDFWCLKSKRCQEDIDEFYAWHAEQSLIYCTCPSYIDEEGWEDHMCLCFKKKWSFQEEILRYCWLDVDVLAEACVKYRDNALQFGVNEECNEGWISQGIDPFQYLTIPQLALNLLLAGSPEEERICITLPKHRRERVPAALGWMERKMDELDLEILHVGNSHREYYCPRSERYLDGVTSNRNQRKHIFVCLNCTFHACPECFYEEIQMGESHPSRPGTYSHVFADTEKFTKSLLGYYGVAQCHIVWEHQLAELNLSTYELQLGNVMKERDMFYGGRTEVFSPYVNSERYENEEIKYHDVCSLYPYVCAFKPLPTGHPEHYVGKHIDITRLTNLNHSDPYFGFVRCTIIPNNRDIIGFLPHRDSKSGRLEFPLYEMTGSWGTEELRVALESGYRIQMVYEVYHWPAEERSSTLLRGYVSFFLRMKQEAEGWRKLGASCDSPSEEEKEAVQERVFQESGCIARIRPDKVEKNAVRRQMAKLFLNSLWGKFCQKPHSESYTVIHGRQQFYELWGNTNLDKSKFSFRHLSGNTWKVKYVSLDDYTKPNAKYNIFLAAKVTEWARCILHRQMKKIGPERILYCDTDSLMFLWPRSGAERLDGVGLGNWVDEYPHDRIKRLYALAPKFYYLEFYGEEGEHGESAEEHSLLKSKGIQITRDNRRLIHGLSLGAQLLEIFFPRTDLEGNILPFQGHLRMKNMIMGINSTNAAIGYGTMTTRYTEDKRLGPVFSKRDVVRYIHTGRNVAYDNVKALEAIPRIYSVPKGYFISDKHALSAMFYAQLANYE